MELDGTGEEYSGEYCEYFGWGLEFPAQGDEEGRKSMRNKKRLQDVLMEPQSDPDLDLSSSDYLPLDDAVEES